MSQHKVYVASSWRNPAQQEVVRALRHDGHDVYDFKNPVPGDVGFSWRGVTDVSLERWDAEHFSRQVLDHPVAARGFGYDMDALSACSACVLLLPCGRSAHLELGYAVGQGRLTIVLMPKLDEPELMVRMCDYVETTLDGVRQQLARLTRTAPRWQRDLVRANGESAAHPRFANRCGEYRHRECKVCQGCWRHGSCECGPEAPLPGFVLDEVTGALLSPGASK